MVYCGKPSRGCQMCRSRRIKCDETKPTCNQCRKSRRQCPGYKPDFDIVFRNETNATARRAKRGQDSKDTERRYQVEFGNLRQDNFRKSQSLQDGPGSMVYLKNNPNNLPGSLSVLVEEQAPCFFITNFCRTPRNPDSRGAFDFILPIIKSEAHDSPLSLAFSAVSFASLANRPNSRGSTLMVRAVAEYGKALRAINIALQTPSQVKTDATLASVLLLGFYETITIDKSNVLAWGSHIDGAVQLTKMRGKKQLRTKIGTALFMTVRQLMLVNILISAKPPLVSADWWISVDEASKDRPEHFIATLFLRIAEIRHETILLLTNSPRNTESFQKVLGVMRRVQALNGEFQEWQKSLPEEWLPKTAAWVEDVPGGDLFQGEVYPGRVDVYSDLAIGNAWQHARTCRLFIIGLIIRCIAWVVYPVDYRTTSEYAYCSQIGVTLMADIIAAIPYHLGWHIDEGGSLKKKDITGDTGTFPNDHHVTSPKALGGFYSMWPLFCVLSADYATDSQRTWAKGRLTLIADGMGLNQARVLSSFNIRVPSMTVRRDIMTFAPPTAAQIAAYIAAQSRGTTTPTPPKYTPVPPITSATISRIAAQEPISQADGISKSTGQIHPNASSPPTNSVRSRVAQFETYSSQTPQKSTSTLPQLELSAAAKRAEWEKEKRSLLKKASNSGGESTEAIIGTFLAI